MATEVDICNLALANLGNVATVASINPPEASVEASLCSRFYPIARDALLEMHVWGFATKRVTLAALTNTTTEWAYCYQQPSDALNLLAILPPDATNDYSEGIYNQSDTMTTVDNIPISASGAYTTQPFSCEIDPSGNAVIYTNQKGAVLRYTAAVSNTGEFSPTFVMTLAWHLSSMLAGPLLKGDVGAAEAKRCAQMMQVYLVQAKSSDANQRRAPVQHNVAWIAGR